MRPSTWVDDATAALLTDLYELTMIQAYWRARMDETAVFSLFVRKLPQDRNYLLAAGLENALRYLETVRFDEPALEYLTAQPQFSGAFIDWLREFRFTGDVFAVPEGTPVFAEEPILEVVAPIAQAQLAETFIMNQVHYQTLAASKAARVVHAAAGRRVVDFGLRRIHGADAGLKAARAFHIAGVDATSNVLAGQVYGLQIAGTMAHSFVQAFDHEIDAFRTFAELYPDTILLVDTYDTIRGIERVIALSEELGDRFQVRGVRLDSGDLSALAREARRLLDQAGLQDVTIFASGGLDEHRVAEVVESGAPVDGFGVGTRMGVSNDAPALDIAYKLTAYGSSGRLKLSPGKRILPGRKQVFRRRGEGRSLGDVIARWDETHDGRPLLVHVMKSGRRLPTDATDLEASRARARQEIVQLPSTVQSLEPARPPFPVEISSSLMADWESIAARAPE